MLLPFAGDVPPSACNTSKSSPCAGAPAEAGTIITSLFAGTLLSLNASSAELCAPVNVVEYVPLLATYNVSVCGTLTVAVSKSSKPGSGSCAELLLLNLACNVA